MSPRSPRLFSTPRTLLTLLVVLAAAVLSASARAQEAAPELTSEQKSKLREALPFPQTEWQWRFTIDRDGITLFTEQADAPVALARLLLKPTPTEPTARARHLLELAGAYSDVDRDKEAAAAAKEAEALFRAVKADEVERKAEAMLFIGRARAIQDDSAGAESAYREAVRLAPGSVSARLRLASYLYGRSLCALNEAGTEEKVDDSGWLAFLKRGTTPEQRRVSAERFAEADATLAEAERFAPNTPAVYRNRIVRRMYLVLRETAEAQAANKPVDEGEIFAAILLTAEAQGFLEKMARLEPEDPLTLGCLGFVRLARVSAGAGAEDKPLPAAEKAFLAEVTGRLEKIGADRARDARSRARAWEAAGALHGGFGKDYEAAARCAAWVRDIDPERSGGWIMGVGFAAMRERHAEQYELAAQYAKRSRTLTARFLFAKSAYEHDRLREAEAELRALREAHPADLKAAFGLGMTLLRRRGEEPETLREVAELVRKLQENTGNKFWGDDYEDMCLLTAGLVALAGQVPKALELLEPLRKMKGDEDRVKRVLAILDAAR